MSEVWPSVSIALCTYNGEKYLKYQIQSYIKQTHLPNEIIVCDDRSTDSTIEIIEKFAHENPSIKWRIFINDATLKSIRNFEKAISLCTGDIIFLSDQDDIWVENKVDTILKYFAHDKKALLLFTNASLIDAANNEMGDTIWNKWGFTEPINILWRNNKRAFFDLYRNYNKVTGATVAFKKELKQHILPIQLPKNYWHDTWFAIHAAGLNGLRFISDCTIHYRIHPEQQVGFTVKESTPGRDSEASQISHQEFETLIQAKYPTMFPEYTFADRILIRLKKLLFKI